MDRPGDQPEGRAEGCEPVRRSRRAHGPPRRARVPAAIAETVPSDPSGAAFWLVAGAAHPDAELRLEGVSTNPTRRAIIDILRRMGASIEEHDRPAPGGADGEPLADLVVRSSDLRGDRPPPADVAAAIDEIPILGLAAAVAAGRPGSAARESCATRNQTGSRGSRTASRPSARGSSVEGDDIEIHGGTRLTGAVTETHDDHRLAMTFAIAGLIAGGRDRRRPARVGGDLLPRLLRRTRRGAGMTKRVVLIGHPVAHSLSGAMQQAAFDELGHRRDVRALGSRADRARRRDRRAARRRLPGRQRHDPAQGAGRAAWSTA